MPAMAARPKRNQDSKSVQVYVRVRPDIEAIDGPTGTVSHLEVDEASNKIQVPMNAETGPKAYRCHRCAPLVRRRACWGSGGHMELHRVLSCLLLKRECAVESSAPSDRPKRCIRMCFGRQWSRWLRAST